MTVFVGGPLFGTDFCRRMGETHGEVSYSSAAILYVNFDFFLVIGVSGGIDSLCLAFLLGRWADAREIRFLSVVIDHGVRAESAIEG